MTVSVKWANYFTYNCFELRVASQLWAGVNNPHWSWLSASHAGQINYQMNEGGRRGKLMKVYGLIDWWLEDEYETAWIAHKHLPGATLGSLCRIGGRDLMVQFDKLL